MGTEKAGCKLQYWRNRIREVDSDSLNTHTATINSLWTHQEFCSAVIAACSVAGGNASPHGSGLGFSCFGFLSVEYIALYPNQNKNLKVFPQGSGLQQWYWDFPSHIHTRKKTVGQDKDHQLWMLNPSGGRGTACPSLCGTEKCFSFPLSPSLLWQIRLQLWHTKNLL